MVPLRSSRALRISGVLLAAVSLGSALNAAERQRSQPLSAFLSELQAAGAPIVFSEALVRPEMQVKVERRRGPLRRVLEVALASCGLEVRDALGGRWLVVERRARPQPATPPKAPGRPMLVHRESVEVREPVTLAAGPLPASLAASQVERTAGAFENVFRSLQLLPGVTPVNEAQGRFSARSGGPDQNLTVVDGVEIHNPFRLEALVSAFNPDTVESFALTTGVMPARYGDRLASVLEVRTRPGRRDRILRGTASLDAASGSVTLEGPLPANRGASWILSARRNTPGHLMERLTRMEALHGFEDLYLRLDWPWRDRVHFSFWTLQGREITRDWTVFHVEQGPITADSRLDDATRSGTWAATVHGLLTPTLSSSTVLSRDSTSQTAAETYMVQPWQTDWVEQSRRRVQIADLALRQSLVFQPSASQRWEAGFEAHRLDTAWSLWGKSFLIANWSLFRGPTLAPTTWGTRGVFRDGSEVVVDSTRDSVRSGAWLQGTLAITPRVVVASGLRVQHSSINGETTLLPRVQAHWRLGSARISASWGRQAQSPGFEKLLQADAFLDYGGSERLSVSSETSEQAVLGLSRDFGRRLSARLELFHTRFDHLIVGRLEPARPEEGVEELISAVPLNDGKGSARGAELSLRLAPPSAGRRGVSGTFSYSYGVSRRESYGLVYPFDYDRRHALAFTAELPLGRALTFSAAWRAASGLPYTPFEALRQRGNPGHGVVAIRLQDLNAARHPFYSRLDLRAAWAPRGPDGWLEVYVDVFNTLNYDLLNGNNGPGFTPSVMPGPDGWQVVEWWDRGSAVVPSFGLRCRF